MLQSAGMSSQGSRETEVRQCMTVLGEDSFQQGAFHLCCVLSPVHQWPQQGNASSFWVTLVCIRLWLSELVPLLIFVFQHHLKEGKKSRKIYFPISRKIKHTTLKHSWLILHSAYFNLFKLARIILFRLKMVIFIKKPILEDAQVSNTYHIFFWCVT